MAIIVIEKDMTKPTQTPIETNIVYVPVFVTGTPTTPGYNIITTTDELDTLIGAANVSTADKVSYNYASKLLDAGLTVCVDVIQVAQDADDVTKLTKIDTTLTTLEDVGEVDIKYITLGGLYVDDMDSTGTPATEQTSAIIGIKDLIDHAIARNDCTIFLDFATGLNSISDKVSTKMNALGYSGDTKYGTSYATTIYPAGTYEDIELNTGSYMPGSFAYFRCLAEMLTASPDHLAIAGATRGVVPYLKSATQTISPKIADTLQPRTSYAINPITKVNGKYCIMGNRTLHPNTTEGTSQDGIRATSFLNTRNMTNEIKKLAWRTCQELRFEQASDALWKTFVTKMTPYLESLKYGGGLESYELIKSDIHSDGKTPLGKGEFAASIKIVPIYAVESFEILVGITDGQVSVQD